VNKPLSTEELNRLKTDFPVVEPKPEVWDRARKLEHLACIVETSSHEQIRLYHKFETRSAESLYCTSPISNGDSWYGPTALGLALNNQTFRRLGLGEGSKIGHVLEFLELTQRDAHTFSCDCGGSISKATAAKRIRWLATGKTSMSRVMNYIGSSLAERFLPSALPTVG